MKTRQRIRKSDAAEATVTDESTEAATHRLTGIQVKEVSIVDRAANKRKYLLVKDQDATTEKAIPGSPAQPAAPPTPPGPPTTPQAPTLRISPELKAKVAGVLKTVQERVGVIAKVLEGSSETPGAAAPPELMSALTELATMIQGAAAPAAPAPGQPTAPAPAPPAAPPPAQKTEETETAKAGRKISAGRLQQLNTIRDQLSSLITDAAGETESSSGSEGAAAEGGESAPAAAPASAEKSAAPEMTELKNAVAALVESNANMTKIFEQQSQRIAELSKSRGVSRQPDMDSELTPTRKQEAPVRWDWDMASPLKNID